MNRNKKKGNPAGERMPIHFQEICSGDGMVAPASKNFLANPSPIRSTLQSAEEKTFRGAPFLPFWLAPDEYGYGRTHRSGAQPSILGSPAELVQALTRNPNTISPRSSYSVKARSSGSALL